MCCTCNLPPHAPTTCTRTECANCSSPVCPSYQQQKEILRIKTSKKCSMREAKIIHKQQQQTLSPKITSATFATVVAPQQPSTTPTTTATLQQNKQTISNQTTAAASKAQEISAVPAPSPSHSSSPSTRPSIPSRTSPSPPTTSTRKSYDLIKQSRALNKEVRDFLNETDQLSSPKYPLDSNHSESQTKNTISESDSSMDQVF